MPKPVVTARNILRFETDKVSPAADLVVTEEPLEIRLSFGTPPNRKQKSISVTMRTPGNDFELALGFLFSEGIITDPEQVQEIRYCTEVKDPAEEGNVVLVYLNPEVELDLKKLERHFYTTSSCGVCGKTSLDAVSTYCHSLPVPKKPWLFPATLNSLDPIARGNQLVFRHTGGIHAATLFDVQGRLLLQREDVGRHNAVDKVIGAKLMGETDREGKILLVSGRAGFELVQKTAVAGIPVMASVGAPSSLAVELADKVGLTLIGFLRDNRFNVYSGDKRIRWDENQPI